VLKMSLKYQEKEKMDDVENLGLSRLIKHVRFENENKKCKNVTINGKTRKKIRGLTLAVLLNDEISQDAMYTFRNMKTERDVNDFLDICKENDSITSYGISLCRVEDNFNKTLGRLIATARAHDKIKEAQ